MSAEYEVLYSREAANDIRDIFTYITMELEVERTAKNQVNCIRDAVRSLHTMPGRHPVVGWEPWASLGMRQMHVDNYVVFYLPDDFKHIVTVVRVLYGGRDAMSVIGSL